MDGRVVTTRELTRGERMHVEVGQGIHDSSVILATGTPHGVANALMALGVLRDRMGDLFGPCWLEEARIRELLP